LSNDSPVNPVLYSHGEASHPNHPTLDAPPRSKRRVRLHLALFVLTFLTTTSAGTGHYAAFISEFGRRAVGFDTSLFLNGLWYSVTILAILGAHEMGHYLYCRRHRLDASLPYFLPLPNVLTFPFLTGTLGAVIRIREPFRTRTQLFDVGIAGPIGGLIVLIPALLYGFSLSTVVPAPTEGEILRIGKPLLYRWAAQLMVGPLPEGHWVNLHPVVFACWFGMFATALNLLPFGQFDGGHIMYAVFGDRVARRISALVVLVSALLISLSWVWVVPTALMAFMWRTMGLRHPSPLNPYDSLSHGRRMVALIALIAFVVCFTPVPMWPETLAKP
jgi:membrane-associated protease RseP (regulator of RpoE activity)